MKDDYSVYFVNSKLPKRLSMSKIKSLFLFILMSFSCVSIAQFGSQQFVGRSNENPTDLISADLDDDGDMDIISCSWSNGTIVWFENFGDGNFGVFKRITEIVELPNDIRVSDLDDDGDMDILYSSGSDYNISWYKNDGNQNFSTPEELVSDVSGAHGFEVADIDEDGDKDIVSIARWSSKVTLHKNDGDENFESIFTIAVDANSPIDVFVADMDGDDDLDVISTSSNEHEVAWYKNIGGGSFDGVRRIIAAGVTPLTNNFARVADLDEDGDNDLVSVSEYSSYLVWYENDGSGNFGDAISIESDLSNPSVFTADLDNDGDEDIAVSGAGIDVVWFENNGDGTFALEQIIGSPGSDVWDIYAADFSGDGVSDIVVSSDDDSEVIWYENDGTAGTFDSHLISSKLGYTYQVSSADVDGDDRVDVLIASPDLNNLSWFKNYGADGFSERKILVPNEVGAGATALLMEDVNGDGDLDLVASFSIDDKISWFQNDGSGNFILENIITTETDNPIRIFAADINGDDNIDILSCSSSDEKIAWYENDGLGNFGEQQIIYEDDFGIGYAIYAMDLNGDSYPDLITFSNNGDKILWFENDGDGNFGSAITIDEDLEEGNGLNCGDVNNDGDIDIIFGMYSTDKIICYENDGLGNFGAQQVLVTDIGRAAYSRSPQFADFDLDGDLDITTASIAHKEVIWFENDGTGSFSEVKTIGSEEGVVIVYNADLNNDEYPDVVTVSWEDGDQRVSWYKNYFGELGIQDAPFSVDGLSVFPNPSNNQVNISFENNQNQTLAISVYNELGISVYEKTNVVGNQVLLSKQVLGSGMFFVRVTYPDREEAVSCRFIFR